jgi:hypothetical protein
MQHAAFRVHLVEFHPAGLRHAQAMPEHQEQQATVARSFLLPLVDSINRSNLAAGEVFSVAAPRQCSPLCVRASFCREFILWNAPETRMNRGGDFCNIYKRDHFV